MQECDLGMRLGIHYLRKLKGLCRTAKFCYSHALTCQLKVVMTTTVGFDQLCWHNFRIIGTNFGGISIEHNASIIGSDLPNCGCG